MKPKIILCSALLLVISLTFGTDARAYNLGPKYIHYIGFFADGRIWFTLYNEGPSGPAFACSESSQPNRLWILACSANDNACLVRHDRLADMLLSAKLAGKPILVQFARPEPISCTVSEVAFYE